MRTALRNANMAICLLVGSVCLAGDPISNLTERLKTQTRGGLWMNGAQPSFTMPSNSLPTHVVVKAAQAWRIIQETNDTLRILEIRKVEINGPPELPLTAALVECDAGKKIILFRFEGDGHLWTRFYDVPADGAITRAEATRVAEEASRKTVTIPKDVAPVVTETEESFVVTYPLVLPKGTRGGDYYTKVTINKSTGKITQLLTAP